MSISQRVIKNTIFLYIRMVISILVNVFTTRLLLEALGVSDYGLYNVVGGAIAMLGFLTSSMSTSTQRFISYAEGEGHSEKVKVIFYNAQILHYGLSLVTMVLLICAGFIFFNGVLNIPQGREFTAIFVYGCLVFSTVFSITVVPYDALLNAHENMKIYSFIGIIDVLLKLIIAIIICYYNADRLFVYAILIALESWFIRFVTKSYCKKRYKECQNGRLKELFNKAVMKEMASFAGWSLINIASSMIAVYGINVIVNHYYGTELNAAMGIATQLSGVLMGVSMNMLKALTPVLVKKAGAREDDQMLEISYKGCKFSFILYSFICIPVCFFIHPILELWLHKVPEYTSLFCSLMLISALLDQLVAILYQTVSAKGNIKRINFALMIPNMISVIMTWRMLSVGYSPYWGLINLLIWRTLVCGVIKIYYSHIIAGLYIYKYFKKVVFPCFFISVLSLLFNRILINLCYDINLPWFLLFIISILISIPIYWYIGLTNQEKHILSGILAKRYFNYMS